MKLDDECIAALYARRQAGETMRSLAEESGVARRTLQRRFRQYATWVCEAEGGAQGAAGAVQEALL